MMRRHQWPDPVLFPPVAGLPRLYRGKVRDSYAVGEDRLLLLASDRLSAFDCVLPTGIPDKGRVLTQISAFWFARTARIVPNHLIGVDWARIGPLLDGDAQAEETLAGRVMLVHRAQRIDVECVVRGYLAGSGWAEYQRDGTLGGLPLPAGLREGEELPEPAFTPAIKNDTGHDENISVRRLIDLVGADLARQLETISLLLYTEAGRYARERGMIIADTKFEFGMLRGSLILIDELLTPDSSRFWPVDRYQPGAPQPSFDKQPVRDYLAASGWNKQPPAPALPPEVVEATALRYHTAYALLTGQTLGR